MPPKRKLPWLPADSDLKRKLPWLSSWPDSDRTPPKRKRPGRAILQHTCPATSIQRPPPVVIDLLKSGPTSPALSPSTSSSKTSFSPYIYNVYSTTPDFARGCRTLEYDVLCDNFATLAEANTFAETVLFTKCHIEFEDCESSLDSQGCLRVEAVIGEECVRSEVWVVKEVRDVSELSIRGAARSEIRRKITEERQSGALLIQGRESVGAWVVLEEGKGHKVYRSRYAAVAEVKRRMEEREHEEPDGTYMMGKEGLLGLRWSRDASGKSVREELVKAEKAQLF